MIEKAPQYQINTKVMKLLGNPEVRKLVQTINTDYLYWDKVKYKCGDFDPSELWSVVKYSRSINSKLVYFKDAAFSYFNTDYISKMLHQFDMNFGGNLGAKSVLPDEDKQRYLISSIMEEAISSSQMEGANTTRKKAKEMLRKEVSPKSKSEQMIVNNYRTIKHIVANKTDALTPEGLLFIHSLIAKDTLDNSKEEGFFRTTDDVVVMDYTTSDIVHTPPSHTSIEGFIEELCVFFNEDSDEFIHPLVKGIIIHFMIGWIHPFSDGNGRTARALFYWYLLRKGYWLTEYLSISKIIQDSKSQYEKAYLCTEMDENDLNYFITYNLNVMEKSFEALKTYIDKKQKESLQTAQFIKIPNINERQAQVLKLVYDEPEIVFTVKEIENRFSVSEFTARADLKGLVQEGYLSTVQVNKVKSNYVKSDTFDKLLKQNT